MALVYGQAYGSNGCDFSDVHLGIDNIELC